MKPSKAEARQIDAALRGWTRGVSFTLAMGKTQVATLVAAHLSQGQSTLIGSRHKLVNAFVGAMRGLADRGLVNPHAWHIHHSTLSPEEKREKVRALNDKPYQRLFEITPAGLLVVELLKLTGIYDELRVELEESDRKNRMRVG
jgi:hypothetical protein